MTTNVTLLSAATAIGSGPASMFPASQPINGTVTVTVTGSPAGVGLFVELFGGCDFMTTPPALATTSPGVFTFTATNSMGIRARLMAAPNSPVTVTASF